MGEICNDNRFEIIEAAKKEICAATNIESSQDEMKVLDSILFRLWQMGWLEKYDDSKPKTNADRIRAMSDEKLAEFFGEMCVCTPDGDCNRVSGDCKACWLELLQQPAEEV